MTGGGRAERPVRALARDAPQFVRRGFVGAKRSRCQRVTIVYVVVGDVTLVSRLKQASISREGIDAMLELHPRRTRIFDKAPLREPSLVLNHKRAFEIDALASA